MARLEALLLCDYAQVRDNLLFVSSAGITRVSVEVFPTNTTLALAMMVYVPPDEIRQLHELVVTFKYPETATKFNEVRGTLKSSAVAHDGEGLHLPVAVPLLPIQFARAGQIDIQAGVDDQVPLLDWSFWLQQTT